MFKRNIEINPGFKMNAFRKLAIASWSKPVDPKTYAKVEMDVTYLCSFLNQLKENTGVSVSVLHAIIRALGLCFQKYPFLNTVLIRNKLYYRKDISIFVHVLARSHEESDPFELKGINIKNPQQKSLLEISSEVQMAVREVRENKLKKINKVYNLMRKIPSFLFRPCICLAEVVGYFLNVNGNYFGGIEDQFGSLMLSDVGHFGIDEASIPLFPFSRCPIAISLGRIKNGKTVLTFTFDHRYFDGIHGGKAVVYLRKIIEKYPERFLK